MKNPALDIFPYLVVPFYKRIESLHSKPYNELLNPSQRINFLLVEFGKNILEAPKLFAYLYAITLLLEKVISAVIWSYFLIAAASIVALAYPSLYLISYLKTSPKPKDLEFGKFHYSRENKSPEFLYEDEAGWKDVELPSPPPEYTEKATPNLIILIYQIITEKAGLSQNTHFIFSNSEKSMDVKKDESGISEELLPTPKSSTSLEIYSSVLPKSDVDSLPLSYNRTSTPTFFNNNDELYSMREAEREWEKAAQQPMALRNTA